MQPLARLSTAGNQLTADQVTSLIRDPNSEHCSSGLELLDITLTVDDTLTDIFQGGVVERDMYATLHGTATLSVAQELDWGTAIVRPFMLIGDGVTFVRFNLGAYLASAPQAVVHDVPGTYEIQGFDILHWLNTPVGEAYTVPAGTGYLDAVEQILIAQGIVAYRIDQTQTAQVLPAPRSWALDSQTTWLNVINNLLAAIGYMGLWSDWDGNLCATQYIVPGSRQPEWYYDTSLDKSMLSPTRTIHKDFFNSPNRWVFFTSGIGGDPGGSPPTEGNGVYTFVNDRMGPTSVAARGRVITAAPEQVDAVDQQALIAQAQQRIDADMRVMTTYEVGTAPNPAHWHMDVLTINDPGIGPISDVLSTSWKLPLNGEEMTHQWSLISGS